MHEEADQHESDQQEVVKQRGGYHWEPPSHRSEIGVFYLIDSCWNYPLSRGTRPGAELTLEQQLANQGLNQRRLRIEHVNSSVKRCRIVKDRIRLWKDGIRDLVMELCCALHNFRVRLTPWQPMV